MSEKKSQKNPTRKPRTKSRGKTVGYWPSHTPFYEMVDFCVRGKTHPVLKTSLAGDHVSELFMLLNGDISSDVWIRKTATAEGMEVRRIVDELSQQAHTKKDLRAAGLLYSIATHAAFQVMDLYLRSPEVFHQIAPRRTLLPALFSIHPNTAGVMAKMRKDARLGKLTFESRVVGSKAWFTSDAPANVYARAIVTSVELNQHLEPLEVQQESWKAFDKKEGRITRVLPFPHYIDGIDQIPVPLSPESVLDYWRKGKEIIMEEMPDFHLHPEWESYHHRTYKNGAKSGAIQHAIFKDILIALRSIAGMNRRRRVGEI